MNRAALAPITPLASLASIASAQSTTPDAGATFSLRWIDSGNANGILEPGERAVLALDVSFTNQNGIASFAPPIGTFGSGTIRGLGSGFLDFHGAGGAQGAWNVDQLQGYGISSDWDIAELGNGTSANGGADLVNVQFGQFAPTPQAINTTNPIIRVWAGTWTPATYATRTVTFEPRGAAAAGTFVSSVALRLSSTNVWSIFLLPDNLMFGAVTIPIVPAPWSGAALAFALTIPHRRRSGATP